MIFSDLARNVVMAIPDLIALLGPNGNSRKFEVELVGIDEGAVPAFITEVQALEPPIRIVALEIIARSHWNFGLDLCRAFFKDPDVDVRLAALRASVKLGGDPDVIGRRTMRELAATDPNCDVQQSAFDALTVFATAPVFELLQELIKDPATPSYIRKRAQKFLANP
jgi:hypothetical protein